MNDRIEIFNLVSIRIHFLAKRIKYWLFEALIATLIRGRCEANRSHILTRGLLMKFLKVSELTSVWLIDQIYRLILVSFSVQMRLIRHSFIPSESCCIAEIYELLVPFSICLFENVILKHNVYSVFRMHQKEISKSRMNAWLTLSTWNHPDLVLDRFSVLEC